MSIHESVLNEAIELTRQLVAIPSENGGGPCEQAMHEYLGAYLTQRGMAWQSMPAGEGRQNLVVRLPSPDRPRVVIIGHMDTVSAQGMTRPFAGDLRDGRILGRGACDDKGPLATALVTLLHLRERKTLLKYDVTIVASCDEESGMRGARAVADTMDSFDLCIALEPTLCRVANTHKGLCRFVIETAGRAAHSSQPQHGVNAIEKMLKISEGLSQYGQELSKSRDAELGKSTLTITQISGGAAPNIVPEYCSLVIDVRLLPGEDASRVQEDVVRLCGADATVRTLISCAGIRTDAQIVLVRALRDAIGDEGGDGNPVAAHYSTDCSQLAHLGPCVVWGPGSIAQAHSANEYIEVAEIDRASRVLWRFLRG